MDMSALKDYLGRAKYGELSAKEFREVEKILRTTSDDKIRRMCIVILGWNGDVDYSALVASFLKSPNEFVQEAALVFLIRFAQKPELCYDLFLEWLGKNSDEELMALTAVQTAGEAYRITHDPYILERLLHFLVDPNKAYSESAKDSLIGALRPDYNDQSLEAERFRASKPTIDDFKRRAEQILRKAKR